MKSSTTRPESPDETETTDSNEPELCGWGALQVTVLDDMGTMGLSHFDQWFKPVEELSDWVCYVPEDSYSPAYIYRPNIENPPSWFMRLLTRLLGTGRWEYSQLPRSPRELTPSS